MTYENSKINLVKACKKFKKRNINADELKEIIWNTAQLIVALEEKSLYEFLKYSEAEIDSLQFTTESVKTNAHIDHVCDKIVKKISDTYGFLHTT